MAAICNPPHHHLYPASLDLNESCASLLREFGIAQPSLYKRHFTVKEISPLVLDGTPSTPLFRQIVRTDDSLQFKSWIGISNSLIRSNQYLPPAEFPQTAARRLEQAKDSLSYEELRDLQRAYNYYFFGNSDLVEDYSAALRIHYAPFEAALYGGELVEILPQASIEVRERPAILLFRELVIHDGGSLKLFTPCRVNAEVLRRTPA